MVVDIEARKIVGQALRYKIAVIDSSWKKGDSMLGIWIGAVGGLVLAGVLAKPWPADFEVVADGTQGELVLSVKMAGRTMRRRWHLGETADSSRHFHLRMVPKGLGLLKAYRAPAAYLARKVRVGWIECDVRVGLSRPDLTALAAGGVDGLMGWWFGRWIAPRCTGPWHWRVTPAWEEFCLTGRTAGHLWLRGWDLMAASAGVVWLTISSLATQTRRKLFPWRTFQPPTATSGNTLSKD